MGDVVTICTDSMQEMVTGLGTSQGRVDDLRRDLDAQLSNARSHVHKAPVPYVSTSELTQVWWWLEEQKAPLSRRLELARLVAGYDPNLHYVDVDESWLDCVETSMSTLSGDVSALSAAMKTGDMTAIQAILDTHMVTVTGLDGSEMIFYDPVFAEMLAGRISPIELSDYLADVNRAGEHVVATQYDQLLRGFAGFLGSGSRAMTEKELEAFTASWASVVSIGPSPTAMPNPAPVSSVEDSLSDFPFPALPIQLLSLVIARGSGLNPS